MITPTENLLNATAIPTESTEDAQSIFVGKYISSIGRRKRAIANVRMYEDQKGNFMINGKKLDEYVPLFELKKIIESPLRLTGLLKDMSITARVAGGGIRGQAEAIALGIARGLLQFNSDLRQVLRPQRLLTRDPREKERKKPGKKRARRSPQWQKR